MKANNFILWDIEILICKSYICDCFYLLLHLPPYSFLFYYNGSSKIESVISQLKSYIMLLNIKIDLYKHRSLLFNLYYWKIAQKNFILEITGCAKSSHSYTNFFKKILLLLYLLTYALDLLKPITYTLWELPCQIILDLDPCGLVHGLQHGDGAQLINGAQEAPVVDQDWVRHGWLLKINFYLGCV